MNEQQWRAQVVDLASWLGWRAYFTENATREINTRTRGRIRVRTVNAAGVGFPDLVLVRVRDQRLVFAELKRDPERGHHHPVTPEQEAWLADLRAVAETDPLRRAIEVYVWRPSDLEQVKEILK